MAAGPGFVDANGVWQFGEADADALFSDLLNLGMDTVSAQFVVDRARISTAEGKITVLEADSGWLSPTAQNSWNLLVTGLQVKYRKRHGMVSLIGRPGSGSTGAAFTLPVGYRPGQDLYFIVQNATTTGAVTTVSITTAGVVACVTGTNPFLAGIPPFLAEN